MVNVCIVINAWRKCNAVELESIVIWNHNMIIRCANNNKQKLTINTEFFFAMIACNPTVHTIQIRCGRHTRHLFHRRNFCNPWSIVNLKILCNSEKKNNKAKVGVTKWYEFSFDAYLNANEARREIANLSNSNPKKWASLFQEIHRSFTISII